MGKHGSDLGDSAKLLVREWRHLVQQWAIRPRHQAKEFVFLIWTRNY